MAKEQRPRDSISAIDNGTANDNHNTTTNNHSADGNDQVNTNNNGNISGNDDDDNGSNPDSSPDPDNEGGPPFPVPGLHVWVAVGGRKLPEYPYDEEDEQEARESRRVSKYVECEPDTVAVIKYRIDQDFMYREYTGGMALRSRFCVNGEYMDNHVDNFRYMPRFQHFSDEFEGRSLGRAATGPKNAGRRKPICEPMRFAPIELRDDIDEETQKGFLKSAGVFEIFFWRVTSERGLGGIRKGRAGTEGTNAVSEKSVASKAINVNVQFDKAPNIAMNRPPGPVLSYDRGDAEDTPLITFAFHYRSREALKQLHVIEDTPEPSLSRSPSPLSVHMLRGIKREASLDEDDAHDDEAQSMQRRYARLRAMVNHTDDGHEDKGVDEGDTNESNKGRVDEGVVVDDEAS